MRVLGLGFWSWISAPGVGLASGVPLGLVLDFLAKRIKKLFCEFLDRLWCFLDVFWRLLLNPAKLLYAF